MCGIAVPTDGSILLSSSLLFPFILGLRHFPELIAELERAIGEVKYGDYILAGSYVSTS